MVTGLNNAAYAAPVNSKILDPLIDKKHNYERCIQLGLEFLGTDNDFVHLEPKDRLFLALQYANGLCQQLNNYELERAMRGLQKSNIIGNLFTNDMTSEAHTPLSGLAEQLEKEKRVDEDLDSGKDVLRQDNGSKPSIRKI